MKSYPVLPVLKKLLEDKTTKENIIFATDDYTDPGEGEERQRLLRQMFAEVGEGCYIEPPLHANQGGEHRDKGHAGGHCVRGESLPGTSAHWREITNIIGGTAKSKRKIWRGYRV